MWNLRKNTAEQMERVKEKKERGKQTIRDSFLKRFIYLFIYLSEKGGDRERGRKHKQGVQQAEGEAGSPSKESDVGLDPRTPRS